MGLFDGQGVVSWQRPEWIKVLSGQHQKGRDARAATRQEPFRPKGKPRSHSVLCGRYSTSDTQSFLPQIKPVATSEHQGEPEQGRNPVPEKPYRPHMLCPKTIPAHKPCPLTKKNPGASHFFTPGQSFALPRLPGDQPIRQAKLFS